MRSLKEAIAYAVGRKRIPLHLADPPVSILEVALILGLEPPVSLAKFIRTLTLPGNFMPGQYLATSAEVEGGPLSSWFQVDVFAVGLDGTPWKFWEFNDGAWMNGVIRSLGIVPASACMVTSSVLREVQMCTPSVTENGVAIFNQDFDGHWDPIVVRIDSSIRPRSFIAPFFNRIKAIVAVDGAGTLQLFWDDAEQVTPTGPMTGVPLSSPGFAPPGAPVAVDIRVRGLSDGVNQGGELSVFVIDNHGALWTFTMSDDETWSGTPMPNPNGVVLSPGAFVATGRQVAMQTVGLGEQSLGYCQLDVFVVDDGGNLQIWWESQGSEWHQDPMPDGGGLPPGAAIATGLQVFELPWKNTPIGNQLDVFVVDVSGRLARWWVYRSGSWSRDLLPGDIPLLPGSHLVTANQKIDDDALFYQLDVFAVGLDGRIAVFWQTQGFDWTWQIVPGSDLAVLPPPM